MRVTAPTCVLVCADGVDMSAPRGPRLCSRRPYVVLTRRGGRRRGCSRLAHSCALSQEPSLPPPARFAWECRVVKKVARVRPNLGHSRPELARNSRKCLPWPWAAAGGLGRSSISRIGAAQWSELGDIPFLFRRGTEPFGSRHDSIDRAGTRTSAPSGQNRNH